MYDAPGIGLRRDSAWPNRFGCSSLTPLRPTSPGIRSISLIRRSLVLGRPPRLRGGLPLDPGIYEEVGASGKRARALRRPATASAKELLAEGLLATVLQHEIDHLDGVLFHRLSVGSSSGDRVDQEEIRQDRKARGDAPARI